MTKIKNYRQFAKKEAIKMIKERKHSSIEIENYIKAVICKEDNIQEGDTTMFLIDWNVEMGMADAHHYLLTK